MDDELATMKWTLEFSEFVIGDDSCKGVGGLGCRICVTMTDHQYGLVEE